jgi:nitroreductase
MNESEILSLIKTRRSVRAYHPEDIPPHHIEQLIEALRWAPSAGNRQPWHFFVISNSEIKRDLVSAAFGQTFIAEAPLVFVICADPPRSAKRYGQRGREMYVYQDTAAASQNLLLTATALGYGTCWVGAFDTNKVAEIFRIPVAIVPVGRAAETPNPTPRHVPEEIVTYLE